MQFPVFISLFYMLRSDLKLQICGPALRAAGKVSESAIQNTTCQSVQPGSGKFLFIPDVTSSAHGLVLVVLITLYVGSQLVSSLLTTATVDRNQRLIALGLPFVFTFVIIGFPAGLILYWITTNLWTVGQQLVVRRYFPPANIPAGSGNKLSLSGLFSRGGDAAPAPPAAGGRVGAKAAAGQAKGSGSGARTGAAAAKGNGKVDAADGPKGLAGKSAPRGGTAKQQSGTGSGPKPEPKARQPAGGGSPTGKRTAAGDDGPGSSGAQGSAGARRSSAPPPSPRKKKKRSGRRR